MGAAGRFGQAVTAGATEDVGHASCQADPVAGGNVEGVGVGAGTQGSADGFSLIDEWLPVSSAVAYRGVVSHQAGFGDPNGRNIRQQSQMASDATAAGMGAALAVTQD